MKEFEAYMDELERLTSVKEKIKRKRSRSKSPKKSLNKRVETESASSTQISLIMLSRKQKLIDQFTETRD